MIFVCVSVFFFSFPLANEVNCVCSLVFFFLSVASSHHFLPEMVSRCLPFLPIIYKSVFGQ